jgi:dihydrofolate synthase/folylpolyglutamate synthase
MLSQSIILYKDLQKRYSRKINLDLVRIQKVLITLGSPHLKLEQPINVLGSDGKMSILSSLQYFLEAHKKNVTTFTSPHLYNMRHRFWLKNRHITIQELKKYIKLIESTEMRLTLFELLTCVYILAAKDQKNIHYNLVEAGLLFKKDSTNLWSKPKAQIVTNINFQHQEWVKPKTLAEICKQKLSSLSQNTTIYIAKQKPETLKIIKNIKKK